MSTLDDKAEETVGQVETTKSPENEQKNGGWGIILIFFVIGLVGSLAVGWWIFPKLLYSQKKQPIDFNVMTAPFPVCLNLPSASIVTKR